jgi:hypothetical protein
MIVSGWHPARGRCLQDGRPRGLRADVLDFGVLPAPLGRLYAWCVPFLELGAAGLLLTGIEVPATAALVVLRRIVKCSLGLRAPVLLWERGDVRSYQARYTPFLVALDGAGAVHSVGLACSRERVEQFLVRAEAAGGEPARSVVAGSRA